MGLPFREEILPQTQSYFKGFLTMKLRFVKEILPQIHILRESTQVGSATFFNMCSFTFMTQNCYLIYFGHMRWGVVSKVLATGGVILLNARKQYVSFSSLLKLEFEFRTCSGWQLAVASCTLIPLWYASWRGWVTWAASVSESCRQGQNVLQTLHGVYHWKQESAIHRAPRISHNHSVPLDTGSRSTLKQITKKEHT